MGLDALVYCDCYEQGQLLEPPPLGVSLQVGSDGSLERSNCDGTLESDLAWDAWRARACKHGGGVLLRHRIGNIAVIGLIRSELKQDADRFPVLLGKVVYSGSHTGDFLSIELIPALRQELEFLREFRCSTRKAEGFMLTFRSQMLQLAVTALLVNKPITF